EALHATLAEHHARTVGGIDRAVALGVVDEVIKPTQTRRRLAETLAEAPPAQATHGNIPL
ncbi:MAG: acyl-CoA carboxylase subunit beta, partial [Pseudonocardiaceae bacterium]